MLAALVALGMAVLTLLPTRDFVLDDAWIHLSYAKSLRLGEGMSYNPGDWETGFSSPLWVLCLALWPLGQDPVLPVKLLGALLHAATAWLGASLTADLARTRGLDQRPLPLKSLSVLSGVLIATTPQLLHGSTSGMEVPLAAALVLATARAAITGATRGAAVLGFLAVLARPEALFFTVALAGLLSPWRAHRNRTSDASIASPRSPLAAALGALVALGAWVLHCLLVSGHPWPNTQYIKGSGGGWEGLPYLTQEVLAWQPWVVSLTGLVIVGRALIIDLKQRRGDVLILFAATVATWVAIALSRPLHPGVGFYEARYFAPFLPIIGVIAPLGLVGWSGSSGAARWLTAVVLLPIAIATGLLVAETHERLVAQSEDTFVLHSSVARRLARTVPDDAVIGVEGAGAHRFFLPRSVTVLDLVGLNDRRAAHLHHDRAGKLCHFVGRSPTHLVLPEHWIPLFAPTFQLEPVGRTVDPSYHQVAPPRPMAVVVLRVHGVTSSWRERCQRL